MKKALPFVLLISLIIASITFFTKNNSGVTYKGALIEREEEEGDEEDNPEEAFRQEFELTKDPKLNIVPTERLITAVAVRNSRLARLRQMGPVSGINWLERGPNNVGGRTRAIIYDLRDSANGYKKVWAGSVGGGLWYTNDITATTTTWNKINDFLPNIAITALIQNPLNLQEMYAGTGEGWQNADAIRGLGIFKSSDGGTTWNLLPAASSTDFYRIQKLAITSNGVVFACTRQAGLQRSADNGATWTKVLGNGTGGGNNDAAADVEIAADGSIYCSFGIFNVGGIYRSKDGGSTWKKIYTSASNERRIELAPAPGNPNRMYVLVQDSSNAIKKIMTTTTAAADSTIWITVDNPSWCDQGTTRTDFTRGQAWYDLIAAVDPVNENTFYIGGVDILKSTNAGASFTQISQWASGCSSLPYVHADIHNIVFRPDAAATAGANNEFLVGCDGGIFRSANAGAAFTARNNNYNVTQFYTVAIHPTLTNYFLCGSQDNGTQKFTAPGINATTQATGGDGTTAYIDQNDGNVQISSTPNNNYFVSINGGSTFLRRSFNNNGSFVNPTDYEDAGRRLYAANTTGTYFRWNNPAVAGTDTTTVTVPQLTGTVTHVYASQLTPNRVYFGMSNGSVVRVDDAHIGKTRTGKVIKTGTGSVSCVSPDLADENHLLITYSNYGVVSVFESKNALSATPTWTSVEGNLPDMPVRWALFDPRNANAAIIATEVGVWSTDDLHGSPVTDWQPTNTGLANVRTDMIRYRPLDRTLAAATHGRGLFTATIPNVTTPDINFKTGTVANSEATDVTTAGCRSYKDYTVQITIANAPQGNAEVTINIDTSSTAMLGFDFDFTTNGDFNSPSNKINFTSGSTAPQTITVRVYDDGEVENDEFARFSYTLAGTSNAQRGTVFQTLAFNITDNDISPILPAPADYTVGTIAFYMESGTNVAPFDARVRSKKTQILYTAAELTNAGLTNGKINSLTIPINKRSTRAYQNMVIKMGTTNKNVLMDSLGTYEVTATTTVKNSFTFTPATSTATGFSNNTFAFDVPFDWDGTSSVVVEFCYTNATADTTNFSDRAGGYQSGTSTMRNTIWKDNIDCSSPITGSGSFSSFNSGLRPQIIFNLTNFGTRADTTLNASKTEYLSSNNDLYFYSVKSSVVLARIRSLSNFNYGCTQVVIDRAGNSAAPFWNNNPANYIMDKTYRVIPATNNNAGSYEITFYFTAAEKQGWEAATGQSFSNIQVIKVPEQVKNITPTNPEPNGPGTVQVVTPTSIGTIGNNFYVTATFNTGFGGFGFGIPVTTLPITLLNFTGKLQGDNVLLQWSTSSEQNSSHFNIEKSLDGTTYRKAGEVKAAGNSNTERRYSFLDKEVAADYNYFRLNMLDNDNRSKLSDVVIVRNTKNNQGMFVINNPFTDYINIRFEKVPQGQVKLQLTDLSGKLIQTETFKGLSQNVVRWNVNLKALSKGVYVLSAIIDENRYIAKVMKQ